MTGPHRPICFVRPGGIWSHPRHHHRSPSPFIVRWIGPHAAAWRTVRVCREAHAARSLKPSEFTHRTSKPNAALEAVPAATDRHLGA